MDKLKALLLPLALVFAAIAVFELGVRYGSTNMRAYSIAAELRLPLRAYAQGLEANPNFDNPQLGTLIDTGIAAGSTHRQIWYLNKQAKTNLDQALTYAFRLRGESLLKRIDHSGDEKTLILSTTAPPGEVFAAIRSAHAELQAQIEQANIQLNAPDRTSVPNQ